MSDQPHSPDDPLPGLIAEIDQMIATAPHIAAAAWGYYSAFREQGFSGRESVYLVAVQFKDSPGTP